jgi:AmmeMemoRadiSam system protein B
MIENSLNRKVREATMAGIFYPEDGIELDRRVGMLLAAANPPTSLATAIIAPHAGFGYSGDLAALAWKSAAGRTIDTAVILAPLHRAEESLVFLPESELFQTPLGAVRVNRSLVEELRDCGTAFTVNDIPHFEEHGIELQLPFLLKLFPEARLVPIILGKSTPASVKALAAALSLVFGHRMKNTLVVLSSDLATGSEADAICRQSNRFISLLMQGDWKSMLDESHPMGEAACGTGCVAAFMASSLAYGTKPILLDRHDSSASRESDQERLVQYMAMAFVPAELALGEGGRAH